MIEVLLSIYTHLTEVQATQIVQTVQVEALKTEIDPTLIYSIIAVESRYQVNAIGGSHGERGLMQLHPRYYGQTPLDIEENIKKGVKVLAKKKKACKDRYGSAWFTCFNTGQNARIAAPRQLAYYKKVMKAYGDISKNLYKRASPPL